MPRPVLPCRPRLPAGFPADETDEEYESLRQERGEQQGRVVRQNDAADPATKIHRRVEFACGVARERQRQDEAGQDNEEVGSGVLTHDRADDRHVRVPRELPRVKREDEEESERPEAVDRGDAVGGQPADRCCLSRSAGQGSLLRTRLHDRQRTPPSPSHNLSCDAPTRQRAPGGLRRGQYPALACRQVSSRQSSCPRGRRARARCAVCCASCRCTDRAFRCDAGTCAPQRAPVPIHRGRS